MKKLVIESGATNSEWCFISNKEGVVSDERLIAGGWNASSTKEDMIKSVKQLDWIQNADEIYFYGAGVSSDYSRNRVFEQLNNHPNCHVDGDLKAACIATLGKDRGIGAILGTGSISCVWDGVSTDVIVPSLGYLLSDEGSGSDLGKEILRAYFYKKMPTELLKAFDEAYQLTPSSLIDNLYGKENPKAYLASFSKFITKYPHEWTNNLVKERLNLFFEIRILPIFNKKIEKIGFIGSISFVFKEYLTQLCNQIGVNDVTYHKSAMEGLINYHKLNNE
jgi:glucosamine kinase